MSEWRKIDSHPHYEVSDDGRVRRVGGDEIGQWPNDHGYMIVRLSQPRVQRRVHRLVAVAFIRNASSLPGVNHRDCNRANNLVSNLEWCTQKENLDHSTNLGRMPRDHWKGKRSPNAKLTERDVQEIRASSASYSVLAAAFGVSKRCIGRVINAEVYRDV